MTTSRREAALHAIEQLGIVAKSESMAKLVELALRVAKVDSTVLLTGESGSGKERIAQLVHDQSPRARGPFIAVNCGAVAETLLESELFGHVRGAFTGATQDRVGLFEAANGGTLLLDEVGEVSARMQVKLLRAVQQREIRRVGENAIRRIDVRLIASTNCDLALAVAAGAFRQDLYYRLRVIELRVPPLRDRSEDVLPLARVFLAQSSSRMNRAMLALHSHIEQQLLRYDWPGNVRELENTMERAVAIARLDSIETEDLPDEVSLGSATGEQPRSVPTMPIRGEVRTLDAIEKEYILAALDLNGGNQTHTAEQLGIGSATLYRKLKSYGLIGGRRRLDATIFS